MVMQNNIKQVACIGSGLIGQGWATLFAAAGYAVTMQDLSDDILKSAADQVSLNLRHLEDNGRLHNQTAAGALRHIRTTLSLAEAVKNADFL